ncbi:MAG: hypothetical protein E7Z92_05970 [Cyanobacteria bacterium SIG31]|nr:hypothetical protein [Cyanobacteria bacterium SIG31]
MRILEVRDGFIKLESNEKIHLSSFLEIKDRGESYIAQTIQSRKFNEKYLTFAKIMYLYDGTFNAYNGSSISREASIEQFPFDLISRSFKTSSQICIGSFTNSDEQIYIDKSAFDRKILMSIDSPEKINLITTNLTKEFMVENNVLVIDMLGAIDSSAKFKAGIDFRLPLNSETLEFLYEDCLNDATSDSKSLVKEIFQDLAEYSKSVPFLPFGTLKTIIDDMVEKSHIFKLLVLKNKLAKFDKENLFANNIEEIQSINKALNSRTRVIDISHLNNLFQSRYLESIYNTLKNTGYTGQVILIASNSITKKNIKTVIKSTDIATTFITHSRFKYLKDFKSLFVNYVIEPTFANNEIFKTYATFLSNMSKESFLLVGDSTNFIPIIFDQKASEEASPLDDVIDLDDSSDEELNSIVIEEDPKDEQTEAIEKKSENLIEKLSEESAGTTSSTALSLFNEEDEEDEEIENISDENGADVTESFEEIENLEAQQESTETQIIEPDEIAIEESQEDIEEALTESFSDDSEYHTNVDTIQTIEVSEEISEMTDDIEAYETVDTTSIDIQEQEYDNSESDLEEIADTSLEDISNATNEIINETVEEYIETEVIPLNNSNEELEEIIELDETELDDNAIIVEMEDPEEVALNQEIIEDVDKVFTTVKEDSLSESDLDFIDELNSDSELTTDTESVSDEELEEVVISDGIEELNEYPTEESEDSFLEPLEEINEIDDSLKEEVKDVLETKNASTPMVPVYGADIPQEDMVLSDPIEQGDTVMHAKYGTGVVEKMIKYGTKTLYSINFDNVGRRLLDPTLTEIKKH